MADLRPKKSLGQHFLKDMDVVQRIVDSVDVIQPEHLLEIGPGEGVLTDLLLPKYPELMLSEVDDESVRHLREKYQLGADRLFNEDFLKWYFPEGQWTIIGNFPYNISTQIVFRILEHRDQVQGMVGMFQKEVAERIASPSGTKAYGILSVLTQTFFEVEYLFTVDEHAFRPPPKVKSGVIRMTRRKDYKPECDEAFLFSVVKMAFGQRRKMLRNSVKSLLNESNIDSVSVYLKKRPEQLDFRDFVKLSASLKP